MTQRKKSGSSSQPTARGGKNKGGKHSGSRVEAALDVQHLSYKPGLTQRQLHDLVREHLVKATEAISLANAEFFPPAIDSAVGIGPNTIHLTFHYAIEEISTFRFKRKNLK